MSETSGYSFGPYRLLPPRRLLLRHDTPVALTPKAFDTLVALVERRDHVVTREELLNHLWPGVAVEEANLTQQVFLLRKVLEDSETDEHYIATVPRRGYRFVKDVSVLPAEEPLSLPAHRARTTRWVAAAGVLALLAAGGAWFLWSTGRIGPDVAVDPNRVVILPFTYRGADSYAYLGDGMMDLLSLTMDGAGPLRAVDPLAIGVLPRQNTDHNGAEGRADTAFIDAAGAIAVARRLGAGRYVTGDIVEAGGTVRIAARLHRLDVVGAPVTAGVQGAPDVPGALFTLVDDLTKNLIGGGTAPKLSNTAAATTSLEALKAFLQGEQLFRGSTGGPQAKAYEAFDRAVREDPTFAIAWYRLSQSGYFSGRARERVTEFAESAARHSGGLPWQARRLIEANWAYARGAANESKQAYDEILRRHQDDVEAWFGLGLLVGEYRWLLGGPVSEYKPRLAAAFLRYLPDHFVALEIQRSFEAEDRNCAGVDSLNHRMSPKGIGPLDNAIAVFCGPPSEAQEALLRSPDQWPKDLGTARLRVNTISQNPRAAAVFARAIVERTESEGANPAGRAVALLALAELELAQGHRKAADEVFAQLAPVNPDWALADSTYRMLAAHHVNTTERLRVAQDRLKQWRAVSVLPVQGGLLAVRHNGIHAYVRMYLLGRISAVLREHDAARRFADELDRMGSPTGAGTVTHDLAQSVRAHVLNSEGRYEDALSALQAARREVPFDKRAFSWAYIQPQERLLRAELLSRLGRDEDALWWYQANEYWPESVLAGSSHLAQAKVLERLGRRQQAIEQYKRVLEVWRDCDPEYLPLVEQARSALQRLGGS